VAVLLRSSKDQELRKAKLRKDGKNWTWVLEFKASTKELKDELDKDSCCDPEKGWQILRYAFITLFWANASKEDLTDICKYIRGCYMSSHNRHTSVSWTARTMMPHHMIVFCQNTSAIWIR
jgi:hypothetical protein